QIGGTSAAARNVISGNRFVGLLLYNAVFDTSIQGNYIGTDVTGTLALANPQGIGDNGFRTIIGGTLPGARNLISGNPQQGIVLAGTNSMVKGNYIGTDWTGTVALGNGQGVQIYEGSGNTIGGTMSGAGNLISGNSQEGIFIDFRSSASTIQGNLIGTDVTGTKA